MDSDASLNTVLLLEFLGKVTTFPTLPRSQQCVFILQYSSVENHLQRISGAFEHTSWGPLLSPLAGLWQSKNLGLDWGAPREDSVSIEDVEVEAKPPCV